MEWPNKQETVKERLYKGHFSFKEFNNSSKKAKAVFWHGENEG
jgi:hypothetical protein